MKRKLLILYIMVSVVLSGTFSMPDASAEELDMEETVIEESPGKKMFDEMNSILLDENLCNQDEYEAFVTNYAGALIDEEGQLIVYYTGDESNIIPIEYQMQNAEQSQMLSDCVSENYQFVHVEYSYDELISFQKSMWDIRNNILNESLDEDLRLWADKISGIGINPEINGLDVIVTDFQTEDYELFNQYFKDYPYELIYSESYEVSETTTLKPGQSLSTGGSLGFRCKMNGVKGFLTTIHSSSTGSTVTDNGTTIGKVTASVHDGAADFSFVQVTNSNYSVGLTTNTSPSYTLHSSHYVVALPVGYTVYLAAGTSTTVKSGQVKYYDYSISSGSNWMVCTYNCIGGDSGGCVFANVNGDYVVCAINDGNVSIGSNNYPYSTKLTTIKDYYSIDIY